MSILVLAPLEGGEAEGIHEAIEKSAPGISVETYNTVQGLVQRLLEPVGANCITVLVPASSRELADLVTCDYLLHRTRIVLVLPDEEEATVSLAHELRPRVLLHGSDFLEYLTPVIRKMKANSVSNS